MIAPEQSIPKTANSVQPHASLSKFFNLKWQNLIEWVGSIFFFGAMAAFFTYPIIYNFSQAVPGSGEEDRLQNLWNFWWLGKALGGLHNPYNSTLLFYPYYQPPLKALPLYFHDLQAFNGLLTWPLQVWGGVAAAYNGVVFLATLLSGLGTYWLVRKLGASTPAAAVAGVLFAFAPIRLGAIQQSITNIQSTEFLPFYALFLLMARPKSASFWASLDKKSLLGAVLALTFCIYTDWYNTIYLLFYTVFYFLWQVLRWPLDFKIIKREVGFLALVGGLTFGLVAPLLLPSIANLNNPDFKIVPGYDREVKSSTRLHSFFLPGSIGADWSTPILTVTGLALASVAIMFLFRKSTPLGWLTRSTCAYWLSLAGVGLVMALGPELQLNDNLNTHLPLPYALFRLLPVVSVTRAPGRFAILAMLGIAVLAAFALDWLRTSGWLSRWLSFVKNPIYRVRLAGITLGILSLFFLVLETWQPLTLFSVKANPFMESLAKEKDAANFNLLELPITRHYNYDHERMYNQITHGRPIIGGYLSRPVVDPYRAPDSPFSPVADLVIREKRLPKDIIQLNSNTEDFDDLVSLYNFRYIILYIQDYKDPYQLDGVINLLSSHYGEQQLVYQDADIIAYRVPDEYLTSRPRDVNLRLGSGWYPLEREANTNEFWRWSNANALVYATSVTSEKVSVKIRLRPFEIERTLQVQLNQQNVFQVKVPAGPPSTWQFELTLPAGRNELRLVSLEGDQNPGPQDKRRLAFAVHSVEIACLECGPQK